MKRFWRVGAAWIVIVAVLAGLNGCGHRAKPAPWPPLGFSRAVEGLSFALELSPAQREAKFLPYLRVAYQRTDRFSCFDTGKHVLELRVFDEKGTEIPPNVVRSDLKRTNPVVSVCGRDGRTTVSWPTPMRGAEYISADGKRIAYGEHTLDIITHAWDLGAGKYTVKARLYSKAKVEEPCGTGQEKTGDGEIKPAVYWVGDMELPPVEIEMITSLLDLTDN